MKKLALLFCMIALFTACGKNNSVISGVSGTSVLTASNTNSALNNFEGVYDLIAMRTEDCAASIQLVRECNGLKLLSNHLGPEEFCNINRGEMRNATNVTLEGNVLKSVVRVAPQLIFTNTLTLNSDGTMTKISNLKSRESRCLYQKR